MISWPSDRNGEVFDENSISAAHPTLPLPSYVRVTNLRNGHSIIARVNDRGPYADNRVIDVSVHTAKLLGFYDRGLAKVRVDYVGPAPLEGSSDKTLVATLREHAPAPAPSKVMVASAEPFVPRLPDPMRHTRKPPVPPNRPFVTDTDGQGADVQDGETPSDAPSCDRDDGRGADRTDLGPEPGHGVDRRPLGRAFIRRAAAGFDDAGLCLRVGQWKWRGSLHERTRALLRRSGLPAIPGSRGLTPAGRCAMLDWTAGPHGLNGRP